MPHSAGCRVLILTDHAGSSFPVVVLYPTASPEQPTQLPQLAPYSLDAAFDAPITPGSYPLVVISHGAGSSPLVYRSLGLYLARRGFLVAMPEHPRNNRNNNELANTIEILENRPRHISLLLDELTTNAEFAAHRKPSGIAVIGHSLGGYTALALAGGKPMAFPHETPEQQTRAVEVTPDPRVTALVLLAPAAGWFMTPGSLSAVHLHILLWTGEKDHITPSFHGVIVRQGVAEGSLVEHRIAENGGHFSFLTPFPATMTNPGFPPSQDPPGFDRAAFQEEMNDGILAFLRRAL